MKDVFSNILPKYLDYDDCYNFGLTCKEYYRYVKNELQRKRNELQKNIQNLFPVDIINMIGKERFLRACPLEWNEKWLGSTDYIDSTKIDDFQDKFFIYYGIDCYKRPFIFLKVKSIETLHNGSKSYELISKKHNSFMINIFQRYTDSKSYVACCRYSEGELLLKNRGLFDDEYIKDITDFLNNKCIEKMTERNWLQQNKTRLEIF